VADASLFPESPGGPPSLTIMALAKRVPKTCAAAGHPGPAGAGLDLAAWGAVPDAPLLAPFAHLGLVDTQLRPKPALAVWDEAFRRRLIRRRTTSPLPNRHRTPYHEPMAYDVRILFLADSHLGFDLPARPRVRRRRRGHDFLANYAAALEPARAGEVDVVVHGGDVFDEPGVAASVAYQALEPLRRVADAGVPVFIVPGNHERSRLPHDRFASHRRVHVFDRPRTFVVEVRGTRLALAGFPYERRGVRTHFPELLERTEWERQDAAVSVLCMHQCVEGATVGPADFTFRNAADVVRARDIPPGFAAVLSGHIHRHQVLTTDLSGRPLAAPVLYPGSIERTSLAEMGEPKGFMIVHLPASADGGTNWEFRRLPARPMIVKELVVDGPGAERLERAVCDIVASVPADAVLTIRVAGSLTDEQLRILSAARLRTFTPEAMNVAIKAGAAIMAERS
jgi:exonuclease SbcD